MSKSMSKAKSRSTSCLTVNALPKSKHTTMCGRKKNGNSISRTKQRRAADIDATLQRKDKEHQQRSRVIQDIYVQQKNERA